MYRLLNKNLSIISYLAAANEVITNKTHLHYAHLYTE